MVKLKSQGGFEKAFQHMPDGRRLVRYSEETLRTYWPNWLKEMPDSDKVTCGCSTCLDTVDVIEAYNGKRRKIIAAVDVTLDEMDESTPAEIAAKQAYSAD